MILTWVCKNLHCLHTFGAKNNLFLVGTEVLCVSILSVFWNDKSKSDVKIMVALRIMVAFDDFISHSRIFLKFLQFFDILTNILKFLHFFANRYWQIFSIFYTLSLTFSFFYESRKYWQLFSIRLPPLNFLYYLYLFIKLRFRRFKDTVGKANSNSTIWCKQIMITYS